MTSEFGQSPEVMAYSSQSSEAEASQRAFSWLVPLGDTLFVSQVL